MGLPSTVLLNQSSGLNSVLLFVPCCPFNVTNKFRVAKGEAPKQAMNGRTDIDEVKKDHVFSALSHASAPHFNSGGSYYFSYSYRKSRF